MKNFLLIAITIIIGLSSCQKEARLSSGNDATKYHLTFKADGNSKSYTNVLLAHLDTSAGYITLTVTGADSLTSANNYFGFYLDNYSGGSPITAGEYKDVFTNFTLLSNYTVNALSYIAGQTIAEEAANNNIAIANHFKVNITSLDKEAVKGNFSGDFYEPLNFNGRKVTITDGSFYVKLQ